MSVFNGVTDDPAPQQCSSCDGRGVWSYGETCWQCGGTGEVDVDGFMYVSHTDHTKEQADD